MQHLTKKSPLAIRKEVRRALLQAFSFSPAFIFQSAPADHDDLDDLVHRMQRSRFDDQRCTIQSNARASEARTSLAIAIAFLSFTPQWPLGSSTQLDEIINSLDRLQQTRLDDQRTTLNQPAKSRRLSPLNEHFFDQLAKSQVSRRAFAFVSTDGCSLGIAFGRSTCDTAAELQSSNAVGRASRGGREHVAGRRVLLNSRASTVTSAFSIIDKPISVFRRLSMSLPFCLFDIQ